MESGITDLLQQLKNQESNWEKYVLEENSDPPQNIRRMLSQLRSLVRERMKIEPKGEIRKLLSENGVSTETGERLIERADKSLYFYFMFSSLRDLERQDSLELKGLIASVFQKFIVRFEPGFLEKIKIGDCEPERVAEIARAMDAITQYYVSLSYTRYAIVNDLREESELSIENCEYWAEMIEQNYLMLKLNYISTDLFDLKE